ncbi:hypothetical protein FRB90_002075 [Tulasnella sp. 427]|nr:hypothetical protein FRB90_002075 [Tulasnella sp. 427]
MFTAASWTIPTRLSLAVAAILSKRNAQAELFDEQRHDIEEQLRAAGKSESSSVEVEVEMEIGKDLFDIVCGLCLQLDSENANQESKLAVLEGDIAVLRGKIAVLQSQIRRRDPEYLCSKCGPSGNNPIRYAAEEEISEDGKIKTVISATPVLPYEEPIPLKTEPPPTPRHDPPTPSIQDTQEQETLATSSPKQPPDDHPPRSFDHIASDPLLPSQTDDHFSADTAIAQESQESDRYSPSTPPASPSNPKRRRHSPSFSPKRPDLASRPSSRVSSASLQDAMIISTRRNRSVTPEWTFRDPDASLRTSEKAQTSDAITYIALTDVAGGGGDPELPREVLRPKGSRRVKVRAETDGPKTFPVSQKTQVTGRNPDSDRADRRPEALASAIPALRLRLTETPGIDVTRRTAVNHLAEDQHMRAVRTAILTAVDLDLGLVAHPNAHLYIVAAVTTWTNTRTALPSVVDRLPRRDDRQWERVQYKPPTTDGTLGKHVVWVRKDYPDDPAANQPARSTSSRHTWAPTGDPVGSSVQDTSRIHSTQSYAGPTNFPPHWNFNNRTFKYNSQVNSGYYYDSNSTRTPNYAPPHQPPSRPLADRVAPYTHHPSPQTALEARISPVRPTQTLQFSHGLLKRSPLNFTTRGRGGTGQPKVTGANQVSISGFISRGGGTGFHATNGNGGDPRWTNPFHD